MSYNDTIIFCVPRDLVMRAVGENGRNAKRISEILQKKVKIIPSPRGLGDIRFFLENIVKPVMFKDLQIAGREVIMTAGSQNKASLIGRNKRRLLELQKIVKDYFGKELRII
jgi:transcription antitermination factor NusA-like protein